MILADVAPDFFMTLTTFFFFRLISEVDTHVPTSTKQPPTIGVLTTISINLAIIGPGHDRRISVASHNEESTRGWLPWFPIFPQWGKRLSFFFLFFPPLENGPYIDKSEQSLLCGKDVEPMVVLFEAEVLQDFLFFF
jgi:hypothetical protein